MESASAPHALRQPAGRAVIDAWPRGGFYGLSAPRRPRPSPRRDGCI